MNGCIFFENTWGNRISHGTKRPVRRLGAAPCAGGGGANDANGVTTALTALSAAKGDVGRLLCNTVVGRLRAKQGQIHFTVTSPGIFIQKSKYASPLKDIHSASQIIYSLAAAAWSTSARRELYH